MATQMKIGRTATRVQESPDGTKRVWYHDTQIVEVKGPWVVLRTDGFFTATTKVRMNQASRQWCLGFGVRQTKGAWFVDIFDSARSLDPTTHAFKGPGIRFNWQTGELG